MQKCKTCLIEHPLENFHKDSSNCKKCSSKLFKKRREERSAPKGWVPSIEYMRENFNYNKDGTLSMKNGRLIKGSPKNNGYINVVIRYRNFMMNRLVWIWHKGECPRVIDHINNDRSDNRIENLQEVTEEFNVRKCLKRDLNTSGFIGVSYSRMYGKYESKISLKGKTIHIGKFAKLMDAALAYNEAAIKYHGEAGRFKADQNIEEMKRRGWI